MNKIDKQIAKMQALQTSLGDVQDAIDGISDSLPEGPEKDAAVSASNKIHEAIMALVVFT